MSITVEITGVGVSEEHARSAVVDGRRLAETWERRFSRFRPESQLCRLNAANGAAVAVEREFLALLEIARDGVRRTGGRFDPSVLPALEAAGYRRSIERLQPELSSPTEPRPAGGILAWDQVAIDWRAGTARLPRGMRIDLGGVAKGAFVDCLAARLAGWPGGAIDAGGDARVWGIPPDGDLWVIGIEDPRQSGKDLLVIEVPAREGAGVATSGTYRRQWRMGDRPAHHLIDPRSGNPIDNGVRAVTAIASNVTLAEIATKGLVIESATGEPPELFGATLAVVVYAGGEVRSFREDDHERTSHQVVPPVPAAA